MMCVQVCVYVCIHVDMANVYYSTIFKKKNLDKSVMMRELLEDIPNISY